MEQLIHSGIIIVLFICIYFIINRIIKNVIRRQFVKNGEKRKKTLLLIVNSIIKYFLMIIAVLTILNVYGVDTTALITSLGLLGLGASLALQDTLKDLLAGFFIIFENQYDIVDTMTINNFKGEVISLGLKTTKLKASTGEIYTIANRNIQEVINHSLSNSLAIVDFEVSYNDNLSKVETVLQKLCKKLTKELPHLKGDVTLLGIQSLGSNGIEYRITVSTDPMEHYAIERLIRKAVKEELENHEITIPYAQVVIHNE